MNELQALLMSLQRCWTDIMQLQQMVAERDQRIKSLEDQVKAVTVAEA